MKFYIHADHRLIKTFKCHLFKQTQNTAYIIEVDAFAQRIIIGKVQKYTLVNVRNDL